MSSRQEKEFWAAMLGTDGKGRSVGELKAAVFKGVAEGTISIGGGGGGGTIAGITGLQSALDSKQPVTKPGFFPCYYNTGTSSWEYANLAAAQAAGLGANDRLIFIGTEPAPAWARDIDLWTEG